MRRCILHTSLFTMTSFMFATLLLMLHAASHVIAYSLISSETSAGIGEITDITNEIYEVPYVGSEERAEEIVDSLLRLVVYFEDNLDIITVDCLFGLRIAQAQLRIINNLHLTPAIWDVTVSLADRIDIICSIGYQQVYWDTPEYAEQFRPMIEAPYDVTEVIDTIDAMSSPMYEYSMPGSRTGADLEYDESTGDECLSKMMGTHRFNRLCTITAECEALLLTGSGTGYHLTHQLLYMIIAVKTRCIYDITHRITPPNVRLYVDDICTQIYNETTSLAERGNDVTPREMDLFVEQILLCGVMEYEDFLENFHWFDLVHDWQDDSGCYVISGDPNTHRNRQLTPSTNTTNEDCSPHMSGLASGVMTLFLRHELQHLF